MNSLAKKTSGLFKSLSLVLIFTGALFFLLHFLIAYFLRKTPHFENFYPYIPWIVTAICAVFNSLSAKKYGKDGIYVSLISSGIIGALFVITGLILGIGKSALPLVLARNVLFVIGSVLLTFYLSEKKQKRRSYGKKFKFSK